MPRAVAELLQHLPPDSLFTADQGFYSYDMVKLLNPQTKFLLRVSPNVIWKFESRLPDNSFLSKSYKSEADRNADRDGVPVRVVRYTINDHLRVGHQEVHVLITNLLDHTEAPAHELIEGYHERWEHELTWDEQKTHQDPIRAEKPAHLRSQTPEGVRQEVIALSVGHFVIRSLFPGGVPGRGGKRGESGPG